jgi:serine protease Do
VVKIQTAREVSMKSKESGKVRYAYGVATALLWEGTAFSLASGPGRRPDGTERAVGDGSAGGRADVLRRPCRAAAAGGGQHLDQAARRGSPAGGSARGAVPAVRSARPRAEQGGPRTRETGSLGSGFIISADGYIVTNNHLIQSAQAEPARRHGHGHPDNRKEYTAGSSAATSLPTSRC